MYAPLRAEKGLRVLSGIPSGFLHRSFKPYRFNQTVAINQNWEISRLGGAYIARESGRLPISTP